LQNLNVGNHLEDVRFLVNTVLKWTLNIFSCATELNYFII